jgi:hypothetical protein
MDIELIENTEQCLADCYAIIKFHPHIDIKLSDSPDSEFNWEFLKEKSEMSGLESYGFEILEEIPYTINIPTYENVSYPCYNNQTQQNETCWKMEQNGFYEETGYRKEYKPFNFWGETLQANKDYYIKLTGKKYPQLGKNNIDWIPTIKGIKINEWAWWNSSWQYKKPVYISVPSSSTEQNYQVAINVTYDSDMQTNFSDLRFVNSLENTELPYWIEKKVDSSWALVWVKIDQNITTTNQTLAYMYYGNLGATSTSNGDTTFELFDDFANSTIDTSKWNIMYPSRVSSNVSFQGRSCLKLDVSNLANTRVGLYSLSSFFQKRAYYAMIYDDYSSEPGFTWSHSSDVFGFINFTGNITMAYTYADTWRAIQGNGSSQYFTAAILREPRYRFNWMLIKVQWFTDKGMYYLIENNGTGTVNNVNLTTDLQYNPLPVALSCYHSYSYPNKVFYVDYVFVSKFHDPEPAYSIGEEKTNQPPNVTLNSPADNSLNNNLTIIFGYTPTDDFGFKNCSLWTNESTWSLKEYNATPIINNSVNTMQEIFSADGSYKWNVECCDTDDVCSFSASNWTINIIVNTPPTQSNPILTSTYGKNFTTDNLTCYNQSTSDPDNDKVTNIYNWYKNNQPLMVLNLPFENSARDYSGKGNNGTIYGAGFVEGEVGKALSFDGINDYVDTKDINEAEGTNTLTVGAWIKPRNKASSVINPMVIAKYYAWNIHINYNNNGFVFSFNDGGGWATDTVTYSATISTDIWYYIVARYDSSTCKIFVNGDEVASNTCDGNITTNTNTVKIGQWSNNEWFNGTIDEVKIYPYALTPEQIRQDYLDSKDGHTNNRTIVSQETNGSDIYKCQITPNDGIDDGITLNSSDLTVVWNITFNITSGEDGSQLSNVNIYCNNSWSVTGVNSPYEHGFLLGSYECSFSKEEFYNRVVIFTADNDKIVNVKLSRERQLTVEEHTWLEAIYNCVILGDCSLYNLLLEINQTIGNIWEYTKPTDDSVITFEDITNKVVNSTSNLTIDYTVNIPVKAGYSLGTYLPIRIGYWFLDEANATCYNQGDKPTGVKDPYCQPLIIETIGPMGGSVNFTVELQPTLPSGNYSIKRIIDIDPNSVWINYGQELIGTFMVTESISSSGISIEKTGEVIPEREKQLQNIKSEITGAAIGVSPLLSGWQIVIIITVIGGVLIVFIISKTILKLKKK